METGKGSSEVYFFFQMGNQCPNIYSAHLCSYVYSVSYLQSHLLRLSLSNMNSLKFTPKKDYTANRLKSGILQLSERTHLVLDETAMEAGQLDTNGMFKMAQQKCPKLSLAK